MVKKKMELEAEAKQLEETERLVEDANVVLDMGEDAAGLKGVVIADLAIYDDDDFLLDLGLEFGLRIFWHVNLHPHELNEMHFHSAVTSCHQQMHHGCSCTTEVVVAASYLVTSCAALATNAVSGIVVLE